MKKIKMLEEIVRLQRKVMQLEDRIFLLESKNYPHYVYPWYTSQTTNTLSVDDRDD